MAHKKQMRSSRDSGYYSGGKFRTFNNKLRRAQATNRRRARWGRSPLPLTIKKVV